jgi:Fe2+ transport system protein FeoA
MAFRKLHGNGSIRRIVSEVSNSRGENEVNVTQLNNGESAKVVELVNNIEIVNKLEAMGIIPDAVITKKSAIPAKGPVIIERGSAQFAIGYEIAQKIIVKPFR